MERLTDNFKNELQVFCNDNHYDFHKLLALPRCGNEKFLLIQYYDPNTISKLGLANKEKKPAEIVLSVIRNDDGSVSINKGEHADKYLA